MDKNKGGNIVKSLNVKGAFLKGKKFRCKGEYKSIGANTRESEKAGSSVKGDKNAPACSGCSCGKCRNTYTSLKDNIKMFKNDIIKIVLSTVLLAAGLFIKFPYAYINVIIFFAAYFISGSAYLIKAFENILKGKVFDENFLMAIATVCAFIIGEYSEAVAVMVFYGVGELFQEIAVARTRKSVKDLMNLRPDYATLLEGKNEERVDPALVKPKDTLIIKPGEKVPVDCTVLSGTAFADTSSLTGESVPKKVSAGDFLYGGVINIDGVLTARAEKAYSESAASRILKLVEESAEKKSKAENFITRFARVYTPAVVIAAAFTAFVIPAFNGYADFSGWLYKALVFLIISCPCAVVISVPLGFFGGIGGASKKGILFKGANYFDALSGAGIVVLDKTGTLTKGTFSVVKILPAGGIKKEELLRTAALAEKYSSHPIAVSIKRFYGKSIEDTEVSNYREISGKGISAESGGDTVLAGNKAFMESKNIFCETAKEYGTAVYVAKNNIYLGYIVISDEIKKESYGLVKALKELNVKKVAMLTGDNYNTAEYTAKELNIDEFYSNLLPLDKVNTVEKIKEKYKGETVVFCGDGINDAPVLARADVGIAMGAMGSDAAIESADVVLLNDNAGDIASAIKISRRTRAIVTQNIIFSIAFKIAIMAAGLLGFASLWVAVFADVGVALLAVLNSSRALVNKK